MNTKWMKLGAIAVAAASLVALSGTAFAGAVPQTGANPGRGGGNGAGMMQGRMGGLNNSLVAVAAKTLSIGQADLVATLNGGKTIAEVAAGKGVALDTIVDAVVAPRVEALKTSVASGRMTQAQADTMIATMKTNITAQLKAPFSPRGNGDGTCDGTCDGTPGQMQQSSGRWGR